MRYLIAVCILVGCATAPPPIETWDRCNTGRVIDACDVSDYPPLTAMLPQPPFPRLLVPIEDATTPPPPTPLTPEQEAADRLLRKLGK